MDKNEIEKAIENLTTDEEIIEFVKKRIDELENSSIEETVGQNYTDNFKDYISKKTHFKATARIGNNESPDLIYDDLTPYIALIKALKQTRKYNEFIVCDTMFWIIYNYLSDKNEISRYFVYKNGLKKGQVSIKEIRDNFCAFCSEKSGLAHNMFKFLGMDSEFICGKREGENHAFLLVYPLNYNSEVAIIYDPSFFVSFVDENDKKNSYGFYAIIKDDDLINFKKGEPFKVDLTKTESNYRKFYGVSDQMKFESEIPTYTFGLEREENLKWE